MAGNNKSSSSPVKSKHVGGTITKKKKSKCSGPATKNDHVRLPRLSPVTLTSCPCAQAWWWMCVGRDVARRGRSGTCWRAPALLRLPDGGASSVSCASWWPVDRPRTFGGWVTDWAHWRSIVCKPLLLDQWRGRDGVCVGFSPLFSSEFGLKLSFVSPSSIFKQIRRHDNIFR
jgi:hypothetical protein